MDGWTDGRTDGWMDGWILVNPVICVQYASDGLWTDEMVCGPSEAETIIMMAQIWSGLNDLWYCELQ